MVSKVARVAEWYARREHEVFPPPGFDPAESYLLQARVPVHLAFRSMARYHTANDLRSGGRRIGYARSAGLIASLVIDVVQARQLAKTRELQTGRRLLIDMVDVAVWSAACHGKASSPPLASLPLVIEAALRRGWPAAFMCLGHTGACRTARRRFGRTFRHVDGAMFWLGVGGALAIRYWEHDRVRRLLGGVERTIAAEREGAVLAGAADVMRTPVAIPEEHDVGFPHDIIGNARPFISMADIDATSALASFVGNRKSAITDELRSAGGPRYLASVLTEWKTRVNRERPRVTDQVRFDLNIDGDALVLLTPTQANELLDELDRLHPKGAVPVTVIETGAYGTAIAVTVATVQLRLSPDQDLPMLDWADPSPAVAGLSALYCTLGATQVASHLRARSVVPGTAAFAALTVIAARQSRRRGDKSHYDMLRLSLAAATVAALGFLPETRRQPTSPIGQARLPGIDAIAFPAVMLGFCWPSTTPQQRQRIATGLGAIAFMSQYVLPRPHHWRKWLLGGLFTAGTGFASALTYRTMTERDSRRAHERLNTTIRQQRTTLQEQGRVAEWQLVVQACDEALSHLNTDDPDFVNLITQRLNAVRQVACAAIDGPSPS